MRVMHVDSARGWRGGQAQVLLSACAMAERGQVLVQSARRAPLQAFLVRWREVLVASNAKRVRWALDVDPAAF